MSTVILDASAILAFLLDEPGADMVNDARGDAAASAVNIAEVAARLADLGVDYAAIRRAVALMDLEIIPFDSDQAIETGALRTATRHRGLSLGDRACLQTAAQRQRPALTADKAWADIDLGVEIRLIRP